MATYTYTQTVSARTLFKEILAATLGSELTGVSPYSDGTVDIVFDTPLTSGDETTLNALVSNHVIPVETSQSVEISTPSQYSTTDVVVGPIPLMESTPTAGRYFVSFTTTATSTSVSDITTCLAVGGVCIDASMRTVDTANWTQGSRAAIQTQAIVQVDGTEKIEANLGTTNGTVTIYEHTLCIVELRD